MQVDLHEDADALGVGNARSCRRQGDDLL